MCLLNRVNRVLVDEPSVMDSVCWGVFMGRFCWQGGFILGAGLLLWVDGRFRGRFHGRLAVFRGLRLRRGGLVAFDVGQRKGGLRAFDVARGGAG